MIPIFTRPNAETPPPLSLRCKNRESHPRFSAFPNAPTEISLLENFKGTSYIQLTILRILAIHGAKNISDYPPDTFGLIILQPSFKKLNVAFFYQMVIDAKNAT